MGIQTLQDLKDMLNTIDDSEVLNKTIKYCFEHDGHGIVCEGAWFDLQDFYFGSVSESVFPTITVCKSAEDVSYHEGCTPWTSLSDWLKEEREMED